MFQVSRHRVFISFHHADQYYKNLFAQMMEYDIVDKSVVDGDIDIGLPTERIRQTIRDEFISDATVTVVLVGPCTWQRKHVDWEIGSSLRDTKHNSRCGLLGILLPNHSDYGTGQYHPSLIPPRLADNCEGCDPFARIYNWEYQTSTMRFWIHCAFERRGGSPPNNGRPQYVYNRRGDCWNGWSV